MTQTVIQIGNSLGVTLPIEFIKKNKLKKGSKVVVSAHIPNITSYSPIEDTDLANAIKEVESRYGHALDELATTQ